MKKQTAWRQTSVTGRRDSQMPEKICLIGCEIGSVKGCGGYYIGFKVL
jgi:hypothetical protein